MLLLALVSFALLLMGDAPPTAAVQAIGWASAAGFAGLCLGFLSMTSAPLRGLALRLAPRRLIEPLEVMFAANLAGKPVLARAAGLSVLAHLFLLAPFGLAGAALGIDLGWQAVFLAVVQMIGGAIYLVHRDKPNAPAPGTDSI